MTQATPIGPVETPLDRWAKIDPLGEALHHLRMNGAFYCRSELRAPWGLSLPPMPQWLWFHVVTRGELLLTTQDGTDRTVRAGEVVLVTSGAGHDLRSSAGAPLTDMVDVEHHMVSDRYELLELGPADGAVTVVLCAAVRFEHPVARNLVDALPEVIVSLASPDARGGMDTSELMQSTLRLLADEARALRPGGEAVVTRLADVLVIQMIRTWLAHDPAARTGWLGALQDPQIGQAITRIHRDPAREWSVASLADELAMSRSSFSARFTALVGEPVMAYVTRWRMLVALAALEDEGATIAELAARLGYRSEAAFARAFKRVIGVPPGAVRRHPAMDDLAVFYEAAAA